MRDDRGMRKAAETVHLIFHGVEYNSGILVVVIFSTAGYQIR
jgi:hypothetical protein